MPGVRRRSLMLGCISVQHVCASMVGYPGGGAVANQYRHWMVTVQPGHVGIVVDEIDDWDEYALGVVEEFREHWQRLSECNGIRYAIGQIEVDSKGFYHIQGYTEWTSSLRIGEVAKRWSGHYEQRNGTRDQARDYCRKKDTRVEELPTIGEWRVDPHDNHRESLRIRAIRAITVDGMSPYDIARELPEVYFVHHAGIIALCKKLKEGGLPNPLIDPIDVDDSLFDYEPEGFDTLHEDSSSSVDVPSG